MEDVVIAGFVISWQEVRGAGEACERKEPHKGYASHGDSVGAEESSGGRGNGRRLPRSIVYVYKERVGCPIDVGSRVFEASRVFVRGVVWMGRLIVSGGGGGFQIIVVRIKEAT